MKFISEEEIEVTIDQLDVNPDLFFTIREELINNQLALSATLTDNGMDLLSDEEYDLLWFILVIIYATVNRSKDKIEVISTKLFEKHEEDNWAMWNTTKGKDLRTRLTPFFTNYPQEDLLAFVEDSIEEDEEVSLTQEGQEVIFITAKTLIDCLDSQIN